VLVIAEHADASEPDVPTWWQQADVLRRKAPDLAPVDCNVALGRLKSQHSFENVSDEAELMEEDAASAEQSAESSSGVVPFDDDVIHAATWLVVAVDELVVLEVAGDFHQNAPPVTMTTGSAAIAMSVSAAK
jgi:hypothetical protein